MLDYISEADAEQLFDEVLDAEGPVMVAGIEFYPSQILKEMYPVAYNLGLGDYLDAWGLTTEYDPEDDQENQNNA